MRESVGIVRLLRKIQEDLNEADRAWDPFGYPGSEWDTVIASDYILQAWKSLLLALEAGGHATLLSQALTQFEKCKVKPLDTRMGPEEPYLVWLYEASVLRTILESYYVVPDEEHVAKEQADLMKTLNRSEKALLSPDAYGWAPCREDDIHARLEGLLGCVYSGMQHKPRITRPIKGFEPDTGLPSIKTLIEYKYVASDDDAKRVVDETLADIGGYSGSAWNTCIFVVYETSRFQRLDEWKGAITSTEGSIGVNVVLLKGIPPTEADVEAEALARTRAKTLSKPASKKKKRKYSRRPLAK